MTSPSGPTRVLFGGDRDVSARLVEVIRSGGDEIVGLGLNSPPRPGGDVVRAAAGVDESLVFYGRSFASSVALRRFEGGQPDLGVCCGFAPILPPRLLRLPRWGWVNVHRSYLPYNRGLDPLQWALVDGTPAGVTIHVMTEQVDAGPVIAQREMPLLPTDDFESLETRSDALVLDLFRAAWPTLRTGDVSGSPQDEDLATYHTWDDCKALRRLDLNTTMKVGRVIDILRAYSADGFSLVEFQPGLGPSPYRVRLTVRPLVEGPARPASGPDSAPAGARSDDGRAR